jgi:glycosyltransferase involved in cell wall biosynthesis
MRVLIITLADDPLDPPGDDRYGGAHLFMYEAGRYLTRKGHFVVFITRKSREDKPSFEDIGPRCQIYRIPAGPESEMSHHDMWQYRPELAQNATSLIKDSGPYDCVLSFNWISGLLALEAGMKPHVHHILSLGRVRKELGEEPHPSDFSRDEGELEVFNQATRLVCVCNDELTSLQRLYPEVDSTKAVIIPYPVDSDIYARRPFSASVFLRRKAERLKEGA